ncbi:hypothetical protein K7432_012764 [Basidiobolus ranarum]|uniref:Uncharacterized protein n=1 Tax=Basidiobolus ranarum TaxID=34480 RepID=A0ABR2VSC9_9FUNG
MLFLSLILVALGGLLLWYKQKEPKEFRRLSSTPDLYAAFLLLTGTDLVKVLDKCYLKSMPKEGIAKTCIKGRSGVMISNAELFKSVLANTKTFPKEAISTNPNALITKLLGNNIVFCNGKVS